MKKDFSEIIAAIEDIKEGRFVVLVDDEDRENEGDLAIAAEKVTPDAVNFMIRFGRGLLCVPMHHEVCDALRLGMMVDHNTSYLGTAFTISVDYEQDTSTGISAHDRAVTIRALANPASKPEDFLRPGHIFPLRAAPGGVLQRVGQTEGIVDLCRLAGLRPVGSVCEILNEDGTMARRPALEEFAKEHGIRIVSIASIIEYRMSFERIVNCVDKALLPTDYGEFMVYAYETEVHPEQHLALVKGEIDGENPVLVRVHSECLTGDVLHSTRCDCGRQLDYALEMIGREGGIILYLRQEGRGIGLVNKIKAYHLQDLGQDTVQANITLGFPPDKRDYGIGAQILSDLGAKKLRILTNNPKKLIGLEGYGLEIVERIPVPLEVSRTAQNRQYLKTKKEKLGHLIENIE